MSLERLVEKASGMTYEDFVRKEHPGLMITTGNGNGFSSLLSRYTDPSELVCVTLLANKEGLDLHALAQKIAAAHNAKLSPDK